MVTFLYYKIWGQKQGIYFINQVILILICTPLYCSRCVTVITDWQFLVVSESFLGFLGSKNHVDPIFCMRGFTKKNFSSKFQFWEKMMPAPPRSKLVQRIWGCRHIQYSSKMLKIGFVFLGNWFRVTDLLLGTVFYSLRPKLFAKNGFMK